MGSNPTPAAQLFRRFRPDCGSTHTMGRHESDEEQLRRLIAQAEAMIAELKNRGTSGDLELAGDIETKLDDLQRRLSAAQRAPLISAPKVFWSARSRLSCKRIALISCATAALSAALMSAAPIAINDSLRTCRSWVIS